jgi:hypothetical protein
LRHVALLILISTGCVGLQRPGPGHHAAPAEPTDVNIARLGGPEASEPIASIGAWVPVQAMTKSLLGQALRAGAFQQVGVPTNGRVCLDYPTNTRCIYFDGVNAHITNTNLINDNGAFIGVAGLQGTSVTALGANTLTVQGATSMVDDATALGVIIRSAINMTNAAAKVASFRNQNVEVASMSRDGYLASATPHTLDCVPVGAMAAGATTYGGGRLPARAFTMDSVRFYVTTASAGAGTTTFRVSDGVNNCDFAIDCVAGVTLTTGAKLQATTSGTCTFAASAALTISSTASTCATTRPTIANLCTQGRFQ